MLGIFGRDTLIDDDGDDDDDDDGDDGDGDGDGDDDIIRFLTGPLIG